MNKEQVGKLSYKFHKCLGVVFCLVGGLFLYVSIGVLLDPEATIRVNGEETNSTTPKVLFTIFSCVFLLIGLFFTLIPKEKYERLFIKNNKLLQKIIGGGKNV